MQGEKFVEYGYLWLHMRCMKVAGCRWHKEIIMVTVLGFWGGQLLSVGSCLPSILPPMPYVLPYVLITTMPLVFYSCLVLPPCLQFFPPPIHALSHHAFSSFPPFLTGDWASLSDYTRSHLRTLDHRVPLLHGPAQYIYCL